MQDMGRQLLRLLVSGGVNAEIKQSFHGDTVEDIQQ